MKTKLKTQLVLLLPIFILLFSCGKFLTKKSDFGNNYSMHYYAKSYYSDINDIVLFTNASKSKSIKFYYASNKNISFSESIEGNIHQVILYYSNGFVKEIFKKNNAPFLGVEFVGNFEEDTKRIIIETYQDLEDSIKTITGFFTSYFENGNIKSIGKYKDGYKVYVVRDSSNDMFSYYDSIVTEKTGIWNYYDSLGTIIKIEHYE